MTTGDVATPTTAQLSTTGTAGLRLTTGAALFAAGVAGEWVLDPQLPDGEVVVPAAFVVCVGVSLVGAVLLLQGVAGTRGAVPERRTVRWGHRTSLVGASLLTLAVATVLVTGLAAGTPHVASFLPYGLGVLALAVGPVMLGIGARRARPALGATLVVSGLAAFASVAIALDPWHDVSLMVMLAAWATAGMLLRRG